MSSNKNETKRGSHERHHTNSNQLDKSRGHKDNWFGRQQPLLSDKSDNTESRLLDEDHASTESEEQPKLDEKKHSKYPAFTVRINNDNQAMSQEKKKQWPNEGQDLKISTVMQQRGSHSEKSDKEKYSKKRKREYQDDKHGLEEKSEQANNKTWFNSYDKDKSDSPPPSHRKAEPKKLKSSNKAGKNVSRHKNILDEAPLSVLQKTQALLKAELAAESTDEAVSLTYVSPVSSSKNMFNLDSEEQIQCSLVSDQPQANPSGDAKLLNEQKGRRPMSRSGSRSASFTSRPKARASKSPNSVSPQIVESKFKDWEATTDKSVSQVQKGIKFEQGQDREKTQTDKKAETSNITPLTMTLPSLDKVEDEEEESNYAKKTVQDIKHEPPPGKSKWSSSSSSSSCSSSSSSSSSEKGQHQYGKKNSEKQTSKPGSRSSSESPSHLRASLLKQIKRNPGSDREVNLNKSCNKKMDAKRNVNESAKHGIKLKGAELSQSRQKSTKDGRPKQDSKLSSSPEPPPVIPRVHRTHANKSTAGKVPVEGEGKADSVCKTTNDGPRLALHKRFSPLEKSANSIKKNTRVPSHLQGLLTDTCLSVPITSKPSVTSSSSQPNISVAAPSISSGLSTSAPPGIKQPVTLATSLDHKDLSSAEETNTCSAAKSSIKKTTDKKEVKTDGWELMSRRRTLDSFIIAHIAQANEEREIQRRLTANRRRSSSTSSSSSASSSSTDRRNKDHSQNLKPVKFRAETFSESRVVRIFKKNVQEYDRENSRSYRARSSSSTRDKKRSKKRSRSKEIRSHKKSKSKTGKRRHSGKKRKSSPIGRSRSRSPQWKSPPRSSWKSHKSNQFDNSPQKRRKHKKHRHGKTKAKSHSKSSRSSSCSSSQNSSRLKRMSSTSSSD